ncbi:MAG: hypothetical protein WC813_00355 [Patescibacteria group bacterium]|jgi:hypothetical protein
MRYLYIIVVMSLTAIVSPLNLFAAQVTVLPEQKSVIENAEFQTDITINTGNESINTFSGILSFPQEIIAVKEVRTTGSIINYWVEEPKVNGQEIHFAGMTPGGFTGARGLLFSVVFTAAGQGQGTIQIKDPLFLKNDGQGTAAKISISNSSIDVLAPDVRRNITIPPLTDVIPPEPFIPEISNIPALYKNAWTVFFVAQDKGTGIDHYEIQEPAGGLLGFFTPWVRVTNPYPLKDQSVSSAFNVRAVDKAGNIRTVHVSPLHPKAWYASLTYWFIIVGIIAFVIVTKQIVWRKR